MSAPPGYNPDESLLEGGTTEIVGVMGGGGQDGGQLNQTGNAQAAKTASEFNVLPVIDVIKEVVKSPNPPNPPPGSEPSIIAAATAAVPAAQVQGKSPEGVAAASVLAAITQAKRLEKNAKAKHLSTENSDTDLLITVVQNQYPEEMAILKNTIGQVGINQLRTNPSGLNNETAKIGADAIRAAQESGSESGSEYDDGAPKTVQPVKRNLRINPMKEDIEKLQSKDIPIEYYALEEINNTFKKLMTEKIALLNVGSELRPSIRKQMDEYEEILIKAWKKRQPWNKTQAVYLPKTDSEVI